MYQDRIGSFAERRRSTRSHAVSLALLVFLSPVLLAAPKADFPSSDIFLFALSLTPDGAAISGGENVSRRLGYDNQPRFTPDSASFLYTRGDDYQTDVYEYVLKTGESRQLTRSPTMEFSPTPTPDNQAFAFVSSRNGSIWLAQRAAADEPEWALGLGDNPEATGYFAWNHERDEMLYWSRYGYSVVLVKPSTGQRRFISGHCPPATPQQLPDSTLFSFVHRQSNEEVWIKTLDPATLSVTPLLMLGGANHNHVWAPDGSLFTIQKNVLYRAMPATKQDWAVVADLANYGIDGASRLAVSPDGKKLAIVGSAAGL